MDKILIRDLLVHGIIGINEWERKNPQEILINIELLVDLRTAGKSDNIEDTISYSTISKEIQHHVELVHRFTVEALAEDIAELCLKDSRIEAVIVRVEKPNAVLIAKSVGVEIERSRTTHN